MFGRLNGCSSLSLHGVNLSLITMFWLEVFLFDISMATLPFFGYHFLGAASSNHSFIFFQPMFVFRVKSPEGSLIWWVHFGEYILIGELFLFTFRVIIAIWRFTTVILSCFLIVLYLHFFLFLCVSVCHLVFFYDIFSVSCC